MSTIWSRSRGTTDTRQRIQVAFCTISSRLGENDSVEKVESHSEHDEHLFIFTRDKVLQIQGYPGLSNPTGSTICISIYRMDRTKFVEARESRTVSIGNEGHRAGQEVLELSLEVPCNAESLMAIVNRYLPNVPSGLERR
jgi:hypothetical protein